VPFTIPPFAQYQAPLVPIAGRWNQAPPEGDKFIPVEIDWGVTVPAGNAVQIALNSGPVQFSQIVAMSVDNGRNGGDVSFLFPDTGKQLTVPAYAQGVYPVFTNALTFYVDCPAGVTGDMTVFEVLNSMPPPVSVLPSQEQSHSGVTGINTAINGTTTIVPAGINGTLQAFSLTLYVPAAATGFCVVILQDGTGVQKWASFLNGAAQEQSIPVTQSGLALRFNNGLNFVVASSTLSSGNAVVNVYYSLP
jgi:hypothetical protein